MHLEHLGDHTATSSLDYSPSRGTRSDIPGILTPPSRKLSIETSVSMANPQCFLLFFVAPAQADVAHCETPPPSQAD